MQSTIAVLPPEVIDQIAAGEVIERPASVVKELVDNAIDAGARTVAVEVEAGGRALIRVVDDGSGMSPSDALLAFERHATSKLRGFDDVWSLSTLGFRGEALPAIASVSRLTLTTRRQGDLSATRIAMDAGRLGPVTEVGAPVGTTVEVQDLLSNVPARLKFLKSDATEASHTTELVAKIAMAYPELHVKLHHNGRTALDAPPDRDVFARAQALLGQRTAARLISAFGEENGVRVTCVLGAPELAQTTARGVQLFVRRRPVRDRGLLHALAVGYGELVPRGRYPVAVMLIDPPDGRVDVNVHPQKAEVRFADPTAVYAAVRHVIQAAIAGASWRDETAGPTVMTALTAIAPPPLPLDRGAAESAAPALVGAGGDGAATRASHLYAAQRREARHRDRLALGTPAQLRFEGNAARAWAYDIKQRVRESRAAEVAGAVGAPASTNEVARARAPVGEFTPLLPRSDALGVDVRASTSLATLTSAPGGLPPTDDANRSATSPSPSALRGRALRYLSQLDLTYLVCEADRELVLIDQHVAHERVELARWQRRAAEDGNAQRLVPTQPLLFPIMLEARPDLVALAVDRAAVLARVGFDVTSTSVAALALTAVPGGIRDDDPARLLADILDRWVAHGASAYDGGLDCALAIIACRTAVRAGDRITPGEAQALLHAMDDLEVLATPGCGGGPAADRSAQRWIEGGLHGRRAAVRLTLADIARQFGGSE